MRRKFDERVVALREAAPDVGLELLVLEVHPVATEAFAEIDHGIRSSGVEQRIEDENGRGHSSALFLRSGLPYRGSLRSRATRNPSAPPLPALFAHQFVEPLPPDVDRLG